MRKLQRYCKNYHWESTLAFPAVLVIRLAQITPFYQSSGRNDANAPCISWAISVLTVLEVTILTLLASQALLQVNDCHSHMGHQHLISHCIYIWRPYRRHYTSLSKNVNFAQSAKRTQFKLSKNTTMLFEKKCIL